MLERKLWTTLHSQALDKRHMLIHQLEQQSGLSRDTIRYYERLMLITPPLREENGYRQYNDHTLVELAFIGKAQEVGFSLAQIKPAIAQLRAPPEQCQALRTALQSKQQEIEERIAVDQMRLKRLNQLLARLGKP